MLYLSFVLFSTLYFLGAAQKPAGECYQTCNAMKREVLTMAMCRDAKKVLPRPKVGDFCSTAMEQGFKDACFALCQGQTPVPKIAQACRAAAIELPRPTVRNWCEHGYRQGYDKTVQDMQNYFAVVEEAPPVVEQVQEEEKKEEVETRTVVNTVPITLDDNVLDLNIYEGQGPEEAVAEFCGKNIPEDVSGCIRQLLPSVLDHTSI
jgi:hypothetical protein